MYTVEFRVTAEPGQSGVRMIEPLVDGVPLRDLARLIEEPYAEKEGHRDIAGSYAGLAYRDGGWDPRRHFLDQPALRWPAGGDTVLLGCGCGIWECWPLTARIIVEATTVTWRDFRNGQRDWDLRDLGPFPFERSGYEAALAATQPSRSGA